MFTIALA